MGIKGFLVSRHFIDGGVTGVSMLASQVTGVPLPVLLPAMNLPFVALGFHQMGALFAMRSIIGIAGLALCLLYTSPSPRDGLLSRMPSSA